MIEETTYLFGMSKDATVGALLGFAGSSFLFLSVWLGHAATKHRRR